MAGIDRNGGFLRRARGGAAAAACLGALLALAAPVAVRVAAAPAGSMPAKSAPALTEGGKFADRLPAFGTER